MPDLFLCFVLLCYPVLVAALRWAVPVQGVLPIVYKVHNFRINSELEQARQPNTQSKEKKGHQFLASVLKCLVKKGSDK
jgi:hypothetical protein